MLESHKLDNIKYLAGKESEQHFCKLSIDCIHEGPNSNKILEVVTVDISKVICVLYLEKVFCDLQLHFAWAVILYTLYPSLYSNNNVCEKSKRLAVNKGQKVHVCLT